MLNWGKYHSQYGTDLYFPCAYTSWVNIQCAWNQYGDLVNPGFPMHVGHITLTTFQWSTKSSLAWYDYFAYVAIGY